MPCDFSGYKLYLEGDNFHTFSHAGVQGTLNEISKRQEDSAVDRLLEMEKKKFMTGKLSCVRVGKYH